MWDQLSFLEVAREKKSFVFVLPCLVYSMSNAILLRFITHSVYRVQPFQRLSWSQLTQQQLAYTFSLYLTTILWDKVANVHETIVRIYSAKLYDWYPPPWYLVLAEPDLTDKSALFQFILRPVFIYLLLNWSIAVIPALACVYCWLYKQYTPSFRFWEHMHRWDNSELGRSAYYLGRPVEQRSPHRFRSPPQKTSSVHSTIQSVFKTNLRRTKSLI